MTAFTSTALARAGTELSTLLVAPGATSGNTAATGSGAFLLVSNASGSAITVTLHCPVLADGRLATSSSTFSVIASTGLSAIPLLDIYASPTTGLATIDFSAVTSVKAAVVRAS
jgi:hypothetical protein